MVDGELFFHEQGEKDTHCARCRDFAQVNDRAPFDLTDGNAAKQLPCQLCDRSPTAVKVLPADSTFDRGKLTADEVGNWFLPTSIMADNANTSSAPIIRLPYGGITASVFSKQVKSKAGKQTTIYNVSVTRGYTNAKGERQYTSSLREDDLLPASHALDKAFELIAETRKVASK